MLAAAVVALVWIVIDMVQHWKDWRDVILFLIGPLGWVIALALKIEDHFSRIKNAFEFGGWTEGIKAIGNMLVDFVLTPLEGILNILGRLPLFGSYFKDLASNVHSMKTPELGSIGMLGASNFSVLGGQMPSWNTYGKTENLAGNNKNDMQNILGAIQGKGGTLDLRLTAPDGYGLEADASNVKGIDVKTSTTKKSSKND